MFLDSSFWQTINMDAKRMKLNVIVYDKNKAPLFKLELLAKDVDITDVMSCHCK